MWSAGLVSVFWALANGLELELSERWHGRHCCQRARLEGCRRACLQARSADDLEPWCRRSDELDLQSCLLEGRGGGSCCPLATTAACRRRACSGQREQQQQREQRQQQQQEHPRDDERCTEPHVTRCLRNASRASTTHKVHCCSQAASGPCRDACLHVLRAAPSEAAVVAEETREDAVDTLLAAGCAAPGLHERLWQCLLGWTTGPSSSSSSSFQQLPADGAKLQCCLRAATIECQRMCLKAYGSEWETSWETFHGQCRYQAAEAALRQCLDDVDEPCELGCPGRSFGFCSHLSGVGKPWALFRRCDASADRAAQASAQLWMRRGPPALPGEQHLQADAVAGALRGCPAHAWKELACVLHLRPCHTKHHASTLCRADCLALAAQCSDSRKLAPLCDSLAPPGAPCLSISTAAAAQTDPTSTAESAVQPCRSRPCGSSTMCIVNRQCAAGQPCSLYRCLPGCPVGSSSSTLVPMGSLARLPRRAEGGRLCWTRCRCSDSGALVDCAPTGCRDPAPLRCWVAGRSYTSGSHFLVHGCMRCRCEAGQVSCSRVKDCALSVPCGCPPDEEAPGEAVCGDDGRSHRSACLARCAGLVDGQWRKGTCQQVDPCADQQCPVHAPTCVAQRRPCLGPCKQHVCLPSSTDDRGVDCGGPVCDTEQRDHASLCALMRHAGNLSSLAYRGSCERACRPRGPVCGLDGETHASECAARAQRVLVDYRGPCLRRRPEDCGTVRCPLPTGGACPVPLIRLPSTCCAICGSGLRLALGRPWSEGDEEYPLSELLWWLRAELSSPECDLFGHLDPALPSFLVVLVVPTSRPTSWTLCRAEAQRIDALVRGRSAALFSLLSMAAVTGSAGLLEEDSASSSAQRSASLCSACLLQLLLALIIFAGSLVGTQCVAAGGASWSSPNPLHRLAPSRRTDCEQTSSACGEVS